MNKFPKVLDLCLIVIYNGAITSLGDDRLMAREAKVIVKLENGIKERFQAMCEETGISMSSMIALLVGQSLRAYERQNDIQAEVAKVILGKAMQDGLAIGSEGLVRLND